MSENAEKVEEEPSIEEILDSIRQIISDDDEVVEEPEELAEEEDDHMPEAVEEEEIVELTEIVDEPEEEETVPEIDMTEAEEVEAPAAQEEPEAEPEPEVAAQPEPEQEPEQEEVAAEEEADDLGDAAEILTKSAETATMSAFAELAQKAAIDKAGTVTVEDIVRAEIRPMLRNWIDQHLPPMLERLLQDELEKIAKRAMEE